MSTAPEDPPTPHLPDRYVLLDIDGDRGLMGTGGRGSIWVAWDDATLQTVAIKVPLAAAAGAHGMAAFRREADILGRISHKNVVRLVDADTSGAEFTPYLATELVGEDTLWRRSIRPGLMSVAEVADVGGQLADALGAVDDAGFVHRDVKPNNAVISIDDEVKLIDFGLAAPTNVPGNSGHLGTPEYHPPEMAENFVLAERYGLRIPVPPPSPSADIYSAGLVIHEIATGRRMSAPGLEGARTRLRTGVPRLSTARPDVPRELDDLVHHMTAPTPEDRPTAAEVSGALRAIRENAPQPLRDVAPAPGLAHRNAPDISRESGAAPPMAADPPPPVRALPPQLSAHQAPTSGLAPVSELRDKAPTPELPSGSSSASETARREAGHRQDPLPKAPRQGRQLGKEVEP